MGFFSNIYRQRLPFYTLVKRDFNKRYLSSFVGLPWAFIQPAIYIFVIWFAFTYGLKVRHTDTGLDFVPWFISGIIPWMYISQTLIVSSNAIEEYSYLIKKSNINKELIPLIKIFSGLIIHIATMILVLIFFLTFYNMKPSVYWLQIFYYWFALAVLLSGISLLISSINVFIHDVAHIVNIIVSMLFWATPIMWPFSMLHGGYRYIALLNPFFYITEGYRYTFILKTWFFEYKELNFFFWSFTLFIFILGVYTFNKLKDGFADVI